MAAKRATPKAAKGKKTSSRAPARKPAPRKPEPARSRVAAAHTRKAPPAAAKKPAAPAEPTAEARRRALPPVASTTPAPNLLGGRPADADDAEAPEPGSLLAGPRNVQPYIVKRGELYMSKEQLEHFRNILNSWKRDLMVEVDRTVSHMKDEAANFPDPNDRATQEEEFSLELRTRDRERKLIRKIDDALKRIEDGSYGYCLETGEEIGIKRLEARPVATLSLEAQERRERRERQYGDRDDRYR